MLVLVPRAEDSTAAKRTTAASGINPNVGYDAARLVHRRLPLCSSCQGHRAFKQVQQHLLAMDTSVSHS